MPWRRHRWLVGPAVPRSVPAMPWTGVLRPHGTAVTGGRYRISKAKDEEVGFSASKGDAKIEQADKNLGESTVSGVWAYQGSKPFISRGRLFSAMGDTLRCVDAKTEKVIWTMTFRLEKKGQTKAPQADSVLTPPVLVNGKVFLGTTWGEVYCLHARSGKVLWKVALGEPIIFQPAVVRGRIYVPTYSGSLYCLETADMQDDGWLMWGAGPCHNGLEK